MVRLKQLGKGTKNVGLVPSLKSRDNKILMESLLVQMTKSKALREPFDSTEHLSRYNSTS